MKQFVTPFQSAVPPNATVKVNNTWVLNGSCVMGMVSNGVCVTVHVRQCICSRAVAQTVRPGPPDRDFGSDMAMLVWLDRGRSKTSLTVRMVVATNSSHSNAPKTVADLMAAHPPSSSTGQLPPILAATAIKPENHESRAIASTATRA